MPDRPSSSRSTTTTSPLNRLLILGAIGVAALVVVLVVISTLRALDRPTGGVEPSASAPTASGSPGSTADRLIRADSPTLGPADAPVTLVEFLDPECEACRAYYPEVKQILADYEGDVRLVVRYVAGHGNSALAAIALEAARAQDETKYWEMLELLFDRQSEWGEQQTPQPQAFIDAATAVGLDAAAIEAAMTAGDTTMVERDLADAQAVGIQGTPTFFVNGTIVAEQSPDTIRAAIDAALAG